MNVFAGQNIISGNYECFKLFCSEGIILNFLFQYHSKYQLLFMIIKNYYKNTSLHKNHT